MQILRPTWMTAAGALGLASVWVAEPVAHAGRNQIRGQVLDRNGQAMSRAVVRLVPGNVELVTDREGWFVIDYLRDEQGARTRLEKRTEYILEVFKPGFHLHSTPLAYKRGVVALGPITLTEDTIRVMDLEADLDAAQLGDPTHTAGANYEGQ